MKMSENLKTNIKKVLNGYNIAVLACIVVILGSLYVIFKPSKVMTPSGIEIVSTNVKENEEITEEKARKVAVKQFKKLGEKNLKVDQLNVKNIVRSEEDYYYITSAENTLEIRIKGGKITRINSATVEE